MSFVQQMAAAVAPWADFYNASKVAQTAVAFGHFGGMMTAGGFALATDRATLRAAAAPAAERPRQLSELAGVHPIVVGALGVTALSGLLMFAADLENLITLSAFWIKMGLVGLLVMNGWLMLRAERSLRRGDPADAAGWRRLQSAALTSLALWLAVVLAGSVLPNAS
jgi:uncharacterized membrane protein